MSALVLGLLSNPTVLAILGGIGAVVFAFFKGDRRGAKRERRKQAQERLHAREEADKIDEAIAGRSAEENRRELAKWSRD